MDNCFYSINYHVTRPYRSMSNLATYCSDVRYIDGRYCLGVMLDSCHVALGSDVTGAAFTVNPNLHYPACPPAPPPVPQKCSQDTQRGVFRRLFRNHSVFLHSRIPKTLYLLNPTRRKRFRLPIPPYLGTKTTQETREGRILLSVNR